MDDIIFRRSTNGDLVAAGRINCLVLSEPFENSVLGYGFIGITIVEVFIGDVHERVIHQKWPISKYGFSRNHSLSETVDYFSRILEVFDPNAYFYGRKKAPYCYINRDHRIAKKMSSYAKKTNLERIDAISFQKCCPDEGVCKFSHVDTLVVRQRY